MIAPARAAAYDVLRAVSGSARRPGPQRGALRKRRAAAAPPDEAIRQDLGSALARARAGLRDERDRALAGEIAAGTLRWRGALDHVIAVFANRPLARLDPEVLDILRMTMFQLLHLSRVPASAAVDDAVNLAGKAGKGSAAPLVNAILRRVSRERDRLPLPARHAAPRESAIDYLSTTLSHPRWLVTRWLDRYGFDAAEAWCRFNNSPAALTLRANRLRGDRRQLAGDLVRLGIATRPTRFAPDGLIVEHGNPLATPLAAGGRFVVQDEASQLVALVAGARAGERVLDACASPGGKTTAMAADMRDEGLIVAADVRPRRVRLLAETVRRARTACVRIVQADATDPPFSIQFDRVLLDAPCSGLGTLRRDPDIRWSRQENELEGMSGSQVNLLSALSSSVRPHGRLVYATCSSEPDENEQVVSRFLAAHPEFVLERPGDLGPEIQPLIDDAGRLRTLPSRDGLEAFFAATLVKARDLR